VIWNWETIRWAGECTVIWNWETIRWAGECTVIWNWETIRCAGECTVIWNWETIRWAGECTVIPGLQRTAITKTFPILCEGVFLIMELFFNLLSGARR